MNRQEALEKYSQLARRYDERLNRGKYDLAEATKFQMGSLRSRFGLKSDELL